AGSAPPQAVMRSVRAATFSPAADRHFPMEFVPLGATIAAILAMTGTVQFLIDWSLWYVHVFILSTQTGTA
ncbi:MAG: hypothetical protein WB507_09130, partial [Solirubrobacterales bacterium]